MSRSIESKLSFYGWAVVSMAFLANLLGFGLVYAYGIFFKPLSNEFGWSRSSTAGPFTFYAIFHNLLAPFAGKLCDRFGPKVPLTIGGLCLGLSMILMRYVMSIKDVYVSYGLLFSIGIANVYTPVMSTVSQWFEAKRGLAMGFAAAGLGAGSLIFSPLCAWLITSLGWRAAYIILGVIAWMTFIPIVIIVKEVPHESKEIRTKEGFSFLEATQTSSFWALGFSWLFIAIALWGIMIHIVPLATDRGMTMVTAGILGAIIGATSIIGRISSGFFSDRVGRKKILIIEFFFQSLSLIWLLFSKEIWMLFFFAILFGLSSGGWTGVIAAFPADYFGHKSTGSILGFIVILAGIGVAIGPYLGGYIYDITRSYNYMIIICIISTIGATISALFLKHPKRIPISMTGN